VVPTVLDLLGLPPLDGTQGRSLVPALRGERLPDVPLFAELPGSYGRVAVRLGGKKWIKKTGAGAIQAFRDDRPGETTSIAAQVPEGVPLFEQYAALCRSRLTPPPPGSTMIRTILHPAVQEKLKALGYVE